MLRAFGGLVLAVAVMMTTAHMTAASASTFVYVGNADSNDIDVMLLDPQSGALSSVQKITIPVEKPGPSTPMAVSPDKRFLFVGIRAAPFVAATFAIDNKTGKLTHVGNGPLADSMAYVATDRTGRYLLSASYGGHKVSINPIGPNGVVGAAHQVVTTPPNAHQIVADPSNRFVMASSLGADVVNLYRFDAAKGTIAPNDPPTVKVTDKAGPRHFVFHPNGKLVYLLNELDGSLVVFAYDAEKGTLTTKQTVSSLPAGFTGKPWAADIHLTPDGKLLYASERTTSTLAGFKVDADGMLTPVGSVDTEKQPRGFAIDPSGRYLLSVGQASHSLTAHAIDAASGKLSALKQYPTGKNPNWVEVVTLP